LKKISIFTDIVKNIKPTQKFMLKVIVEKSNVEKALKIYKSKVIKTRQSTELNNRKEFVKKSVKRRQQIMKAKYVEKTFKSNND
jgi:ribosomal protein S21